LGRYSITSSLGKFQNDRKSACAVKRRPSSFGEELAFLDSLNGALVSTSAAGDTDVSVDDVLVSAFGNSLNGALVSTSAALDASISDNVSHDITSICVV
jgi:hypothetical protein